MSEHRGARGVFYTDGSVSDSSIEKTLQRAWGAPVTPGTQQAEAVPRFVAPEVEIPIEVDIPDDATDAQIRQAVQAMAPTDTPVEVIEQAVRDIRIQMPIPIKVEVSESVQTVEGMTLEDVLAITAGETGEDPEQGDQSEEAQKDEEEGREVHAEVAKQKADAEAPEKREPRKQPAHAKKATTKKTTKKIKRA